MTKRLTKIVNGAAVIDAAAFPDRAQETLDREMNAFPPFREVVKRLAEFEDEAWIKEAFNEILE